MLMKHAMMEIILDLMDVINVKAVANYNVYFVIILSVFNAYKVGI